MRRRALAEARHQPDAGDPDGLGHVLVLRERPDPRAWPRICAASSGAGKAMVLKRSSASQMRLPPAVIAAFGHREAGAFMHQPGRDRQAPRPGRRSGAACASRPPIRNGMRAETDAGQHR